MNAITKIETNADDLRDERAPLFYRYPGQINPQPGRITIDPEAESIEADYNGEIGNGVSFREWHRRVLTLSVTPYVKGAAIADLLESDEFQASARTVIDGHAVEWDGHNHVGRLTDAGESSLEHLQEMLDGLSESDLAQVWDVSEWLDASTYRDLTGAREWVSVGEHRITAATTDEQIAEIAEKLEAESDVEDVELIGDVEECLRGKRDWCAPSDEEEDDDTAAE